MRDIVLYATPPKPDLGLQIVSPRDFPREPASVISVDALDFADLIPYCLDFRQRSIVFAIGADPIAAAAAPFHHVFLREHASAFVEIPVEQLPPLAGSAGAAPTLIFSPGRCGSTLLNRFLNAMGAVSISEPDFYTQVAFHTALLRSRGQPVDRNARAMLSYAGRQLIAPYTAAATPPLVLKFRSQATFAPDEILASFAERPRTLFITRNFEDWCVSRMRAFPDPLEENFQVYVLALQALSWLRQNTECLTLQYERLDENRAETCARIATFLKLPTPSETSLNQVAKSDSQAGTSLSRDTLSRSVDENTKAAIRRLWQTRAPRSLLRSLDLESP
jgi:hypothetical protein